MSEQARIETAIDTTIDNCEVLRARLAKYEDAEGRPLRALLLPERKPVEPLDFNRTTSDVEAMAHNACLDEVARLNQPASAGDENSEEGLEEWAKGKFGIGGRYTGKLYGNTDWALARVVWSAALARAALSTNHSEQVRELPECVRAWFEAKKQHVKAVGDYNARLAFVKQHMPLGTSVDPEYQIMETADRKVRDLVWPMFVGLMEIAAPSAGSQEQE